MIECTIGLVNRHTIGVEQWAWKVGVASFPPGSGLEGKYMLAINSESWKTPSLTPQKLIKSNVSIFEFSKNVLQYPNFEQFFRRFPPGVEFEPFSIC